MSKALPQRPNLDHLRRQSKSLLDAIERGEKVALDTIRRHLPAANGMDDRQIRSAKLRLADAQSAIARQSGFASWPQLSRHVEQLRALEGTWEFDSLEIDASPVPVAALSRSRILIDGDRFRTESPEAVYEGVFNIDVESDPHCIDIEFIAGPEAGNCNYGLFRLDGDRLEICLDTTGKARPTAFRTSRDSGHALEVLRRASHARPVSVTGGTPPQHRAAPTDHADAPFPYTPSPLLTALQGEWAAVNVVRDGQELPGFMLATGLRSAAKNEVTISFGGKVMIHVLVRINDQADPVQIDYQHLSGPTKGTLQRGIMKWDGKVACFCMAAPGDPAPADFACPAGSGRTLSRWLAK